jgi:3-ketosteroid 9alpha-monooxygenase subunit B
MVQESFELRVAAIIEETSDARSIVLEVPDNLRGRFSCQAGQFLTFEIPWEGWTISRCYSLSSAPGVDEEFRVTVKRVPHGRASNWIHDRLRVGDPIRVRPPEGRFVLSADAGASDLTLFAAGSGITPVLSLIKAALATTERRVLLVYANQHADSIIFGGELREIEARYPRRFMMRHHLDSEAGLPTVDGMRRVLAGREAGEFYVCGPAPFMEVVESALEQANVPLRHVHFERFVSLADPDRRSVVAGVARDAAVPEVVVIQLGGRKHTVPYVRGESLLAAARRAGLRPASSCEEGFCGSCLAQRERGDVAMRVHEALTVHEVAAGRVLLCQAYATSAEPVLVNCDATSFRIAGSRSPRALPRALGVLVFLFVCTAIWILRSTG